MNLTSNIDSINQKTRPRFLVAGQGGYSTNVYFFGDYTALNMNIMQSVLHFLTFGSRSVFFSAGLAAGVLILVPRTNLHGAVPRLLVLEVRAGENVEVPDAIALFRRFRSKLRSTGLVSITLARTTSIASRAAGCSSYQCAAREARRLNFEKALFATVRKPGRDYVADFALVDTGSGRVEVRIRRRLPSLEPEDREQGSDGLARAMEADMRRAGYRPPRRLTRTERWLTAVPGVGQMFTGQYLKGSFFISAGFLTFMNFREARREHLQARKDFDDLSVPTSLAFALRNEPQLSLAVNTMYADQLRDNLDARARVGNTALFLLGGLLVWNFLDAENDYEYFSGISPRFRYARLEIRPSMALDSPGTRARRGSIVFVLRGHF